MDTIIAKKGKTMKGRDAVIEIFDQQGVEYVFGNPGTTEFGLITALAGHARIKYILALQEAVALSMAHMYANASGKTGVVNLHVAPGLGNAMGSLYNAAMGKMPLVVTAGQQDSRMLICEPLLSHDLTAMAKPLTKWAVQVQHVKDIPLILSRAFKIAQDPPRGPVFVSLPGDVLDDDADFDIPKSSVFYRKSSPDAQGVEEASKILSRAKAPVIICGDGVSASNALHDLVELAERLGAPVWNTLMMGALNFPTSHPQFKGVLPGEAVMTRQMLGQADVVLAVGAKLFDDIFYTGASPFPDNCALIHVGDASWEIGKNFPVNIGLLGDVKQALGLLSKKLNVEMTQSFRQSAKTRRASMGEQKEAMQSQLEDQLRKRGNSVPISPLRLMAELRDCLPENAIIYNEAVTAYIDLISMIPFDRPGSLFGNHGGGIGQGLPGALGVKLAKPEHPVIALVGDGSAMYTIQSFWTAAFHHIPVLYIILSNQSYRILKYNMNRYLTLQKIQTGKPYPFMDFKNPSLDFVGLAQSMGLPGRCVEQPEDIRPALLEALAVDGPYVLEVRTEGRGPGEQ
jgi:benzoylformate decarboxylase